MVFQKLMKKRVGNLIALFCILSFLIYIISVTIKNYNTKKEINTQGIFTLGYIIKINIGGRVGDSFDYTFYFDGNSRINENFVKKDYSRKHKIGDTIIIKFLPPKPEKSIIIEDKEYKSCMGLPPKVGWKKLPVCK